MGFLLVTSEYPVLVNPANSHSDSRRFVTCIIILRFIRSDSIAFMLYQGLGHWPWRE